MSTSPSDVPDPSAEFVPEHLRDLLKYFDSEELKTAALLRYIDLKSEGAEVSYRRLRPGFLVPKTTLGRAYRNTMKSERKGNSALKEKEQAHAETVLRTSDYARIEAIQGTKDVEWSKLRKAELDTVRILAIFLQEKRKKEEEKRTLRTQNPKTRCQPHQIRKPRHH